MKKKLLILSLLFTSSCGLFTENHKESAYRLESGKEVKLTMYEENYPIIRNFKGKLLRAYLNGYSLEGKPCDDTEAKKLADDIWGKVVKQNDLSGTDSGGIRIVRRQTEALPEFCNYSYSRKENGDWSKDP